AFVAQCEQLAVELHAVAPWLGLDNVPAQLDGRLALVEIARLDLDVTAEAPALREAIAKAAEHATARIAQLHALADDSRAFADIDYELVYDANRHLMSIGYVVADHKLDASRYDLLASEARLASFVAIAQGKLPQEHWFSLGRQLTSSRGLPALVS